MTLDFAPHSPYHKWVMPSAVIPLSLILLLCPAGDARGPVARPGYSPAGAVRTLQGSRPRQGKRKMVENSAPDFELNDLSGKTVTLEQFIGEKIVILEFWATWCGPCRMTMQAVHNTREKFKNKGVEVLSVNQAENPEKVRQFVETRDLKLWVLLDRDNEVSRAYGVMGIPTMFVIDKAGVVRARVVGFRPDLESALETFLNQLLEEKPAEETPKKQG